MIRLSRQSVGQRGEALARQFLLDQGYEIITTAYRFGKREIDIIARQECELVFVEVKSNTSLAFGQPEERVNRKKQEHLVSIAQQFIQERHLEGTDARFDVIAVLFTPDLTVENINHIKHAFWVQEKN